MGPPRQGEVQKTEAGNAGAEETGWRLHRQLHRRLDQDVGAGAVLGLRLGVEQ